MKPLRGALVLAAALVAPALLEAAPRAGSAHPAAGVELNGTHLALTISAADSKAPALTWTLDVKGNKPTGVQKRGSVGSQLTGVRAPELKREPPKAWADAEPLRFNDELHRVGSTCGFIAPAGKLARLPGAWESFEVTLVGRVVTVVCNGVTTIDHQEIPGITGGALDSNGAAASPIYIQGDHTGGLKYRNITIALPGS